MLLRDWRLALRAPPTYRIGNRSVRFQVHFFWILLLFGILAFLFYYLKLPSRSSYINQNLNWAKSNIFSGQISSGLLIAKYNATYPLTKPLNIHGITSYRIGIIADLDTNSACDKKKNTWKSYLRRGYMKYNPVAESVTITWDSMEPTELTASYALKGRGMELSELVVFNGKLYTFDDRTGIIYELDDDKVIPWILLSDGNGHVTKGFKSEWATVKDQQLYVGSIGKEWTTSEGDFESYDPMYVKVVSTSGEVKHINWVNNFKTIRSALSITWPGYMIHESGVWSPEHKKWFFLPRRLSKEKYNDTKDEHMGANILLSTDDNFSSVHVTEVGDLIPTHGFSSFKFVPGTRDEIIVALKTEEINGNTASYIMAFTVTGKVLMKEEKISSSIKYEGIEFI